MRPSPTGQNQLIVLPLDGAVTTMMLDAYAPAAAVTLRHQTYIILL